MAQDHEPPRCSFCSKTQEKVRRLVAGASKLEDGTNVYICNECVALCVEIISDDE